MFKPVLLCGFLMLAAGAATAQGRAFADAIAYPAETVTQTEADEYTRYELLAPESASFRITYEVTATTAGARVFYNPIRKGSIATDEAVYDAMTGKPLKFEVVHGADARKDALMPKADVDGDYIKVTLARAVPMNGQGRLVIVKTYKDAKSYYLEGAGIVFARPLGIQRNKVVLPAGYEVTGLTVPSQILTEPDGRISISFLHAGAGEAPLVLRAAKTARTGAGAMPWATTEARPWEAPFAGQPERARLAERAHQDRDIVYFLQQPETHSFALFHDYTESRPGINAYANVVRTGSTASDPSAYLLDTGEVLKTRVMTGAEMKAAHLNAGDDPDEPIPEAATVVIIPFAPVDAGGSRRLRIAETYTAPVSYRLEKNAGVEELVFDRSLGRPRNAVVLPAGWYCTASATPGTVTQMPDGRVRLDFWAGTPEAADVLVKARRRP